MKVVINVAEKPSIAKHLISALAGSSFTKENSLSIYNPIFTYKGNFQGVSAVIKVTSVTGHVREMAFNKKYQNWNTINPRVLLKDAEIEIRDSEDKLNVIKNLKQLSGDATDLFLWLDCDREGEAIAYEVIDICMSVNRNLKLHRAKFSSVNPSELIKAFETPATPNINLNHAVLARQEVDLRSGAAFTRFQTNMVRKNCPTAMFSSFISFGTCQFPTLSFIVDRFLKHVDFKNNKFWYIKLVIDKDGMDVELSWKRQKMFDKYICGMLYEFVMENPKAVVRSVRISEGTKLKPYPLTTVDLQNLAVSKLRLTSDRVMKAAEKLYTDGFISYPRTDTNMFSDATPFKYILKRLESNTEFGDYIKLLSEESFHRPRKGKKNDEAHPPIHPIKNFTGDKNSDEGLIFDLVARHFAACCSKDAIVENIEVIVDVNSEEFNTKGLKIKEKNFLRVYDKYYNLKERQLPTFVDGEVLILKEISLSEGETTPPKLLTESDLITLMDKNGIGTDATIHEHIKTIQDRKYAYKQGMFFKPTQLGLALLGAYKKLESDLANPFFRAETEINYTRIANGQANKDQVVEEILGTMEKNFAAIESNAARFMDSFTTIFNEYKTYTRRLDQPETSQSTVTTSKIDSQVEEKLESAKTPSHPSNLFENIDGTKSTQRTATSSDEDTMTLGQCKVCNVGNLQVKISKNNLIFVGCTHSYNCGGYFFKTKLSSAKHASKSCEKCKSPMGEFGLKGATEFWCLSAQTCPDSVYHSLTRVETNKNEKSSKSVSKEKDPKTAKTTVTCYFCKKPGHVTTNCPDGKQKQETKP